jgi:hypothetical protein
MIFLWFGEGSAQWLILRSKADTAVSEFKKGKNKALLSLFSVLCRKYIFKIKLLWNQVWWHIPIILALGNLRQEDHKFRASLDYIERPGLRKTNKQKIKLFQSLHPKVPLFYVAIRHIERGHIWGSMLSHKSGGVGQKQSVFQLQTKW